MRLHEVLKTGRPIRRTGRVNWPRRWTQRPDTNDWYITDPAQDQWMNPDWYLNTIGADLEDILATDWETKEPKVEITRAQLETACREVAQEEQQNQFNFAGVRFNPIAALAAKLGLE